MSYPSQREMGLSSCCNNAERLREYAGFNQLSDSVRHTLQVKLRSNGSIVLTMNFTKGHLSSVQERCTIEMSDTQRRDLIELLTFEPKLWVDVDDNGYPVKKEV